MSKPYTGRWVSLVGALLLAGLLLAAPAAGQAAISVADFPSCAVCRIEMTPVRTLGEEGGLGFLGSPNSVVKNGRGWYLVSHQAGVNWFSVFDEEGEFLRRVGRRGQGPGEFGFVRLIRVGPADSVVAADNSLGRLTWYGPDLQLARTEQFTLEPMDLEVLPRGGVVAAAQALTREGLGHELHVADGGTSRAFGAGAPPGGGELAGNGRRSVALGRDGSIWAVHFSDYIIERWRLDGTLLQTWTRDAEWFEPHEGRARIQPEEPPRPVVVDIKEDVEGRIWMLLWVADPDWRSAIAPREMPSGAPFRGSIYVPTSDDAYRDSLIEVFDPRTGQIVVSQRLDPMLHFFVGVDEAASYVETATAAFVQIWNISLIDR